MSPPKKCHHPSRVRPYETCFDLVLTVHNVLTTHHEEPHCVVSSGFLLLPLSLGPDVFLTALFCNTLRLCCPLNATDAHKHVTSVSGVALQTRIVGD
jgi:hypothetical protein